MQNQCPSESWSGCKAAASPGHNTMADQFVAAGRETSLSPRPSGVAEIAVPAPVKPQYYRWALADGCCSMVAKSLKTSCLECGMHQLCMTHLSWQGREHQRPPTAMSAGVLHTTATEMRPRDVRLFTCEVVDWRVEWWPPISANTRLVKTEICQDV